jgi:hypothetical protein
MPDQGEQEQAVPLGTIRQESKVQLNVSQSGSVHVDMSSDTIVTTDDKVRLWLIGRVEKNEARNAWIAPAGLFVSLWLAILTSSFKDFLLKAAVWEAIFIICAVVSLVWLIVSLYRRPRFETVDQLINGLKRTEVKAKGNGL